MAPLLIHHIEMCVKNGLNTVAYFVNKFCFELYGQRQTTRSCQWVLKSGVAIFLVTQRLDINNNAGNLESNAPLHEDMYTFCCENQPNHETDSVFNVVLIIEDVDLCVSQIINQDCGKQSVVRQPESISDKDGYIRQAIVNPGIGNVVYTLVDKSHYKGAFLPGFSIFGKNNDLSSNSILDFDHLTYCIYRGTSDSILEWHSRCLGMKRFLVNREDTLDNGFSLNNIGMRLKAMSYWCCSEVTMATEKNTKNSLKLVFAESLPVEGPNQIDTFLNQHEGPGIQHIGLTVENMITTVSDLMQNEVTFRKPPSAYYTEIGKLSEIQLINQDLITLEKLGILVDCEADGDDIFNSDDTTGKIRYLMQIFTYPVFDKETFFLEVIQRKGATGFGAGNITALWKSAQVDLK